MIHEDITLGPVRLIRGDCTLIAPTLKGVDAVITDPPFSERTHSGHDAIKGDGRDGVSRSGLSYKPWGRADVSKVCDSLPTKGWCCFITDHSLAVVWEEELRRVGRYVFCPVPIVCRGRSVRLTGDGPSSWTDWMVVSRTKLESKWGTLPGVYDGARGTIEHMGGKPINAMCNIVNDYTRQGDTVLDICMGSGTTLIAAIRTGRRAIGIEIDERHFRTAVERVKRELAQPMLPAMTPQRVQQQDLIV